MSLAMTQPRQHRPSFWAKLWQDFQPFPGRATEAFRIACAGMLIVAVQMSLRYELMYPAMTTLLVVNEIRGFSTITRFIINFCAITVSCGAAVALMALFMQQPMFLLPIMAGYITVVMYFMGASRYRSAMFNLGYPFVVVVYMAFFDKTHAEHIAIIVYKSAITGLACGTLVLLLLWPESPVTLLRELLVHGMKDSAGLLRRLADAARGRGTFDVQGFVPERFRAKTPKLLLLADQVQVDCGLGQRGRHELFALVSLNARAAAAAGVVVEQLAVGQAPGPAEADAMERLAASIEEVVEGLERAGAGDPAEAVPESVEHEVVRTADDEARGDVLSLLAGACVDAARARRAVQVFARARTLPDILTLTLRNLRDMADRLVLQPIREPNPAMVKHAFKCSATIMFCAIFCIAINWSMGIGCVETVMLVVQGTFGGTLLIGGLRMAGVVIGFALAILLIIFLIPTVTTLPGFWLVFGGTLFLTSWGVAGPLRISVPCLQAMIVVDFSLLQVTRPDISLLPAMNFALAVSMGVLVTVAVYWLLWPVKAGKVVRPTLSFMLERVAAGLRRAAAGSLSAQAVNVMQSTVEEELAKCVAAHTHAQFERHESTHRHELELRAIVVVEQACHGVLVTLAAHVSARTPAPEVARAFEAAAARFARASARMAGKSAEAGVDDVDFAADAPAWMQEIVRASALLQRLPGVLSELDSRPEGDAVRLGVA
jgi:multidrug resistance protein MdtO